MKLMKSASNRCEKRYAEAGYQWSFMDYPIEQRIRAPTAEHMHLSRFSISLRYAAILFTALSHLARERRLPPLLGYSESLYALAIYSVFNRFRYIIDARSRRTMKEWSRTIDTRIKHGYNAAASLARNMTAPLCSRCHSQGFNSIPQMRILHKDDGSSKWCCTRCGGTETLRVRFTAENIRKRECKVASDLELYIENAPFYEDFKQIFLACLENSSKLREDLAREFDRQEIESNKLSFHTRYSFFIQHYDPVKKGKRRCSIPKNGIVEITVNDSTYRECIRSLADFADRIDTRTRKVRGCVCWSFERVKVSNGICL